MDIIQPDLRYCGGITEGRKIAALASAAGVTLVPHAYGITHLHLALAFAEIPMVEYFPLPCWDTLPDVDVEPIFLGEPSHREATWWSKPGQAWASMLMRRSLSDRVADHSNATFLPVPADVFFHGAVQLGSVEQSRW